MLRIEAGAAATSLRVESRPCPVGVVLPTLLYQQRALGRGIDRSKKKARHPVGAPDAAVNAASTPPGDYGKQA